jgi:hypothetical protein
MKCSWCKAEAGEPCPQGGGEWCRNDVPRYSRMCWPSAIGLAVLLLIFAAAVIVRFVWRLF